MALKFLTDVNLLGNQLQNAVIQVLAIAPSNPKEGQIYYNSGDKLVYRYDGANWGPIGVVYSQGSSTGAVITGLGSDGTVTTTNVTGLTLTGYTPVEGGYVTAGMSLQEAMSAMDTAIKNAVAGGGEVNQNAWSKILIKAQSTAVTAVAGATEDTTLSSDAKVDTLTIASGNKWVDINGEGKTVTIGHSLSGATAGTYGDDNHVAKITVDAAGHVTAAEQAQITPVSIGADPAGSAAGVLGQDSDTSDKATVYGARALADEAKNAATAAQASADAKVASVTAADGITVGGTTTAPTVGIKLDSKAGNAATLSADGLMVTIPEVDVPEYSIVKLDTATTGYLSTYQLQKNGTQAGVNIDIPKDYLVKSASIKTSTGEGDPSGFPAGTKYIDFVINTYDSEQGTGTESHIYLNVQDLVDAYTAGNGIEISDANVVSAKVMAANGLSVDVAGIKMGLASADSNGAMSSGDFTKLAGIDEGATKDTITLNGTATKEPTFYAPIGGGTAGQYLTAGGDGVAPTWVTLPTILKKYTAQNAAITAAGGVFTWTITAATHGISFPTSVQLFEVASGAMVMTDVVIASTGVTISINDTASAGTLTANTYRVVIIG